MGTARIAERISDASRVLTSSSECSGRVFRVFRFRV